MHRASYRFMPFRGITETLSDAESVSVVHQSILEKYFEYGLYFMLSFKDRQMRENVVDMRTRWE